MEVGISSVLLVKMLVSTYSKALFPGTVLQLVYGGVGFPTYQLLPGEGSVNWLVGLEGRRAHIAQPCLPLCSSRQVAAPSALREERPSERRPHAWGRTPACTGEGRHREACRGCRRAKPPLLPQFPSTKKPVFSFLGTSLLPATELT